MIDYALWRVRFAEALDDRLYDLDYLDRLVLGGRARFWSNDKAAIVAELRAYPAGGITVHGLIAAGEIDQIRQLIPFAEDWGRSEGAIAAEIESRPGWMRVMRGDGYAPAQLKLWKDL